VLADAAYARAVIVPIWISSWEIECCQPEASVGHEWVGPALWLRGSEPWWRKYVDAPLPPEVETLGVADLEGEVVVPAGSTDRPGVFRVGTLEILVPEARTVGRQSIRGRLHAQSHQGPTEPGFGLHCRGVVRRVRGIPLVYELRDVVKVPVAQGKPVELQSTGAGRPPDYLPGVAPFPEFLIDLEIDDSGNDPSGS
jgi:hypothetical protein